MRVVVSRTIKNIVKMKYTDDALYVVANIFITRSRLRQLIAENSDWINSQKQQSIERKQKSEEQAVVEQHHTELRSNHNDACEQQQLIKDIFAGRKTMVLGDVIKVEPSMSSKTYLDGNSLYIAEKYFNDRELRIKAIKSYLKKIAFLFVASEVSTFGSSVSLCPQKIEFKDVGDCWCKCSLASQKILCFDYRLTQLPQNLRNYVIAHAFAHFQFSTHSEAFWNHISNVIPHYEDLEQQLATYNFLRDL